MSAKLSDLIPDQELKTLATGLEFTEGPVWNPEGYLLFSDIPANIIYRWAPGESAKPYITPSGQSNGLTYDRQGRLLACEHAGRRVSRMDANGEMATVVGDYRGTELNSPNDVVVHSNGSIYFTDPPYGRLPELGELGFFGVYRVDPDGSLHLLLDDFARPNGLAFTPMRRCFTSMTPSTATSVSSTFSLMAPWPTPGSSWTWTWRPRATPTA